MWTDYFKLVKLVPGKVITQSHGTVDFRENIPVKTCRELYENDFPYLEITQKGKEELYGFKPEKPKARKSTSKRKSKTRTVKRKTKTSGS